MKAYEVSACSHPYNRKSTNGHTWHPAALNRGSGFVRHVLTYNPLHFAHFSRPHRCAHVHSIDSSQLVSVATYQKDKSQGFTKAIIRGYQEICGSGGCVDPNFVQTYKNARAAGITNIDMYWFPCTGSGNPYKSYKTQLSEIAAVSKLHAHWHYLD